MESPPSPINIYRKLKQRLEAHVSDAKFIDAQLAIGRKRARVFLNVSLYALVQTVCVSAIVFCYLVLAFNNAPGMVYLVVSWLVTGTLGAIFFLTYRLSVSGWGAAPFNCRRETPYFSDLNDLIVSCDLAVEMFDVDAVVRTAKHATKLTNRANYELELIRDGIEIYRPKGDNGSATHLVPVEYFEVCGSEQPV